MAQVMPRVSVVIPHYSDVESLAKCLAALDRQTVRPDEIVVADNNSPMGTAPIEAVIAGRAKLVVVAEKGAGPARNGGVAASTGDLLAFTDCDCVPEPGWLEAGLKALSEADFVGGAMRVLVEQEDRMTGPEAFERVFAFDNRDYVLRKGFTVTANLFCPRALFDRVGGFRVGVSEDLEWCLRAREAGYRIGYAADAVVGHPARRTWPELQRKWQRLNVESYGLVSGSLGGRLKWIAKALLMPVSAAAHAPRLFRSRQLPNAAARWAGLATLVQLRLWRTADSLALVFRRAAHSPGKAA
jgi:GT2 family glycosyltransferase